MFRLWSFFPKDKSNRSTHCFCSTYLVSTPGVCLIPPDPLRPSSPLPELRNLGFKAAAMCPRYLGFNPMCPRYQRIYCKECLFLYHVATGFVMPRVAPHALILCHEYPVLMAVPLVNSIQIDRSQSLFYFSAKVTWLVQDVSALSTRTNVEYGIHNIFMDTFTTI